MKSINILLMGCGILSVSSILLGFWLRRHPSLPVAKRIIRTNHAIVFLLYLLPFLHFIMVLSHEGFTYYDKIFDIPLLPFQSGLQLVGTIMILLGVSFVFVSILSLGIYGEGLPAFTLSETLAAKGIYARTRNPMSFSFYLICASIGLLAGSTFFILLSLIIIIPAHIIFLKYFEEIELDLRFGQPYIDYKNRVPFLFPKIFKVNKDQSSNNKN